MQKNYINLYIALLLALISTSLKGQIDVQSSLYMVNPLIHNPANAGTEDGIRFSGNYRTHMGGFSNSPQTYSLLIDAPIPFLKGGLGVKFANDTYGLFDDVSVDLMYSYALRLNRASTLRMGLKVGYRSQSIRTGDIVTSPAIPGGGTSGFHQETDPGIPTDGNADPVVNFGLGARLETVEMYASASLLNIFSPDVESQGEVFSYLPTTLFISGGYKFETANSNIDLMPSAMVKTDFNSWQYEADMRLIFRESFWGGLGYRFEDAIKVMFGIELESGLSLAYSFDVDVSKLEGSGNGAHEVFISYVFPLKKSKRRSGKNLRIL